MAEKVPRLRSSVDVRKFKLDATDGFVLTRIDGRSGKKELARDTGLPEFSVERALDKLEKLGIIEHVDPNATLTSSTAPGAAPAPQPEKPRGLPQFGSALSEPKYDPKELEEVCDLSQDQKKRILDMFYRLDDLDHYTLLGVTKEADKKAVKRAYFELAAHMHPDKYFKKNLGSFKSKMEVLFGRVTEAHDTLVDKEKRAEYDAYIDEVASTRGMEAMLERALDDIAKNAPVESAPPSAPPATKTSAPPPPSGPAAPSPEQIQARKDALARRLMGNKNTLRPTPASAPPPEIRPRYTSTVDAMDALKRRYEERIENVNGAQARKYLQTAEDALQKRDVVAAAAAFSIAVKYAPGDVALARRQQEVKNEADQVLANSYTKQAQYEERSSHFGEAARSWEKVANLKPQDAKAHGRVAHCLLHAEDADLHVAAEHARQAVQLEPKNVDFHVTLAEVYLKAGLMTSARRAAEAGLQLEPSNEKLTGIAKKAAKG